MFLVLLIGLHEHQKTAVVRSMDNLSRYFNSMQITGDYEKPETFEKDYIPQHLQLNGSNSHNSKQMITNEASKLKAMELYIPGRIHPVRLNDKFPLPPINTMNIKPRLQSSNCGLFHNP